MYKYNSYSFKDRKRELEILKPRSRLIFQPHVKRKWRIDPNSRGPNQFALNTRKTK